MGLPTRIMCVVTVCTIGGRGMAALSAQQVLPRGPVHEAFARPVERRSGPTPAVPREPPPPLVELLPQERPEGDNIRWIPGYWAWDTEREDFLWVSGTFRLLPRERRYLPGYWTHSDKVWRWVPGLWLTAGQKDLTYLPEPPAPMETGPKEARPNRDSIYRPGYWRYDEQRFVWQEGSWAAAGTGRVFVSPQYQWTPAGYLFVDGYEDYPLTQRGQLFAVVAFTRVAGPYRPVYAINLDTILSTLFHLPGSYRYSLGDYFASSHVSRGYQPWFGGVADHDPLLAYYEWEHRADPNWLLKLQQSYDDRAAGKRPAPPRILESQGR